MITCIYTYDIEYPHRLHHSGPQVLWRRRGQQSMKLSSVFHRCKMSQGRHRIVLMSKVTWIGLAIQHFHAPTPPVEIQCLGIRQRRMHTTSSSYEWTDRRWRLDSVIIFSQYLARINTFHSWLLTKYSAPLVELAITNALHLRNDKLLLPTFQELNALCYLTRQSRVFDSRRGHHRSVVTRQSVPHGSSRLA